MIYNVKTIDLPFSSRYLAEFVPTEKKKHNQSITGQY